MFWNVRGIIYFDFFEKGKTFNDEYYANLFETNDQRNKCLVEREKIINRWKQNSADESREGIGEEDSTN